jgi:hypothetical protein
VLIGTIGDEMARSAGTGRGRPAKPEAQRKRSNLTFRVREHLRYLLQLAANRSGRSLSEEIEHRLERSLSEEVLLYGIQDPIIFLNAVNTITIVLASLERQTGRKAFGPDGDPWLHEQAWSALSTWFAATRPAGAAVAPAQLSRGHYRGKSPPKSVINALGSLVMASELTRPGGAPDLDDFRGLVELLRDIYKTEKEAQPLPDPAEARVVFEQLRAANTQISELRARRSRKIANVEEEK